jgi:hypothetical protein
VKVKAIASRLLAKSWLQTDVKLKLLSASELRDSIDLFTHTLPSEYTLFLEKLMPVFLDILRGPPVFISTSPEQVGRPEFFEEKSTLLLCTIAN